MNIITYNEALTELCNTFDSLISPRTISRSNTNVIYLLLKAFAKGWEVINNVCVALTNKFDPATCSDEDLESVAFLVGTERKKGSKTGLIITAVNNDIVAHYLPAGLYTYNLDANTQFTCTLTADVSVAADGSYALTFLSTELGAFPVTAQADITVSATDINDTSVDVEIPSDIKFANASNSDLLGYTDETNLEFRQRVLSDTERQDSIKELELKLRNLPYVFDCNIVFNPNTSDQTLGDYIIKPYYMLILLSTAQYTEEIAELIAQSAIYPTVNVENVSHELRYNSPVFADGYYLVYVNEFDKKPFDATVTYYTDPNYISAEQAESIMRAGLFAGINSNKHTDRITTEDFYTIINKLDVKGVTVLGIQFYVDSVEKMYIDFLRSEIAELSTLTFAEA